MIEIQAGDPSIYSNPDVFKPETKPGALEKLVHVDVRGTIQRLESDGVKVNLISTKKGFMRSGDLHENTQFDGILSGEIELWTLEGGKTVKRIIGPNTFVVIRPHVPHLFHFREDSVMMEWWDGPFSAWFYKPWRDIIEEQFKKMTQGGSQ